MIFSVSTPPHPDAEDRNPFDDEDDGRMLRGEDEEYISITSLSLRVLTPLLGEVSATNYEVWYYPGFYEGLPRGNLNGWTLVSGGNSLGEKVMVEVPVEEVEGEEEEEEEEGG